MKTKIQLSLLIIFSSLLVLFSNYQPKETVTVSSDSVTSIVASTPSGFYTEDFSVELTTSEDAEIYYTEDGTFPSKENGSLYEEPITISCYDEISVYTLKCIAYTEDTTSPVITYTYFTGKEIQNRYDTFVINISGANEDLYGYDHGILVEGKARADYLAANPNITEAEVKDPAGYNLRGLESERPVTIQIFDPDGTNVLTQHCGLRVSGNYTRGKNQKSLQLFARSSYDQHGTFHTTLFPHILTQTDQTILSRNNRLLLRNSGDDFNHGFIRDTLVHALARDYGFPLAYTDIPACVYINGQYAGFYWLREPYQNGYMETVYGLQQGEFITISLNEYKTTPIEDADRSKQDELKPYIEEYQKIYDTFADANFSDEKVFENFCKKIDVENYLQYFAIELYIGNKDWPYNNVKAYKFVPDNKDAQNALCADDYMPFQKNAAKNINILDGRYRYLLFDSDYSFYLQDRYVSYAYDEDNMAILSNNAQAPVFSNLMVRQDCRSYFINALCDLMNDSFSYANIEKNLMKLDVARRQELSYFLAHSDAPDATVSMETVAANVDSILEFAENRPDYMHQFIQTDFPVSTPYTLAVDIPSTVKLSINTIEQVKDGFSGNYYADCGLFLNADVDMGHQFGDIIINGKHFNTPKLSLNPEELAELLGNNTELSISVIVEDADMSAPVLYTLDTESDNDEITFYNPSSHEVTSVGLYITDDEENLRKTAIPTILLAPGESFKLYGRKNQSSDAAFQPRMGFNLRTGETLIVSDTNGNILNRVTIPDMQNEGSVYQLDLFTGCYYEKNNALQK